MTQAPRAVFFDEEHARAAAARLVGDGFDVRVERERFAGEDDDEDQPWVVVGDAPPMMLELLVEQYDGWLEVPEPPKPAQPLVLPDAPRRIKRTSD